jgi:hypothetical protein
VAKKIQEALKKKALIWGWRQSVAEVIQCPRQRITQIVSADMDNWEKADHTPKNNANQCSPELEELVVHLVKQDFDASLNLIAKHTAVIVNKPVSANLVKGVRARNNLVKPVVKKSSSSQNIRTSYQHVVSIDVVRENGKKIFGMIQDKTKLVYQYLGDDHTAEEALKGLKEYISMYGKPDAVRSDHGSEFRSVFEAYLKKNGIYHIMPLPYNPGANGFIERYFRTLRQDLFRKLRKRDIKISQAILDDYAFLWNHCRHIKNKGGKTPAQLAGIQLPQEMLKRFQIEKQTVSSWTFWYIKGIHGLLHAYLSEETLSNEEQKVS